MSAAEKAIAPNILDLIKKSCQFPALPNVLLELNEALADPDVSVEDLVDVIASDQPVATNVLRIVNSAYYGLQVRISSINLAVSIMGFNMTKNVVLKAAVFSSFARSKSSPIPHFDPEAFWTHSMFVGALARVIGLATLRYGDCRPEDLYTCGLLHDIGMIILHDSVPDTFAAILERSVEGGRPVNEVEEEVLGYTHADVGSLLATKWNLPEDVTVAIRYHESPEQDPFHQTLSSLICLADRVVSLYDRPAVPQAPCRHPADELLETVGVRRQVLGELVERAEEDCDAGGLPW